MALTDNEKLAVMEWDNEEPGLPFGSSGSITEADQWHFLNGPPLGSVVVTGGREFDVIGRGSADFDVYGQGSDT